MENNTVTIPVKEYRDLVESWAVLDYVTTDVSINDDEYGVQSNSVNSKYHVGDKFKDRSLSEKYTVEHVSENTIDDERQYLLYIEEYVVKDGFETSVENWYEVADEGFLDERCVKLN